MTTTFRGGFKITGGRRLRPLQNETYSSQSDPTRSPYRATIWEDGDLSCNCRGWATHKHCRHTDDMRRRALALAYGATVRDLVTLYETTSLDRQDVERSRGRAAPPSRPTRRVNNPDPDTRRADSPDPNVRRIRL